MIVSQYTSSNTFHQRKCFVFITFVCNYQGGLKSLSPTCIGQSSSNVIHCICTVCSRCWLGNFIWILQLRLWLNKTRLTIPSGGEGISTIGLAVMTQHRIESNSCGNIYGSMHRLSRDKIACRDATAVVVIMSQRPPGCATTCWRSKHALISKYSYCPWSHTCSCMFLADRLNGTNVWNEHVIRRPAKWNYWPIDNATTGEWLYSLL